MAEWCPFATQRPGPSWKVGYDGSLAGPKRGEVKHSAEGWWPGIYSRLDGADRASWHFTVGLDRVEQHYPLSAHCWHAGNARANMSLVGIEHLGVVGQPLTPYQVEMTTKLTQWAAEQMGYRQFRRGWAANGAWVLVEHNEVSDLPTACPSGRIPWTEILRRLTVPTLEQRIAAYGIIVSIAAALLQGRTTWTQEEKQKIKFLFGL